MPRAPVSTNTNAHSLGVIDSTSQTPYPRSYPSPGPASSTGARSSEAFPSASDKAKAKGRGKTKTRSAGRVPSAHAISALSRDWKGSGDPGAFNVYHASHEPPIATESLPSSTKKARKSPSKSPRKSAAASPEARKTKSTPVANTAPVDVYEEDFLPENAHATMNWPPTSESGSSALSMTRINSTFSSSSCSSSFSPYPSTALLPQHDNDNDAYPPFPPSYPPSYPYPPPISNTIPTQSKSSSSHYKGAHYPPPVCADVQFGDKFAALCRGGSGSGAGNGAGRR